MHQFFQILHWLFTLIKKISFLRTVKLKHKEKKKPKLTPYIIIANFNDPEKKKVLRTLKKKEKHARYQLSTIPKTNFIFLVRYVFFVCKCFQYGPI